MTKETMIKSTVKTLQLMDGQEVKLTLNFKRLLEVRSKNRMMYDRYNKVIMNGIKDTIDVLPIIYTAYMCGLDDMDEAMSMDDFTEIVPPYVMTLLQIARELVAAKNPEASEQPSEARNEKEG